MKLRFLITALVLLALITGGNYLWRIKAKKEKVYVLYTPDKDERINWSHFQDLFPADFDHTKTLTDIGELSQLDEDQLRIYDSILAVYYSQPHLIKNENNFYLTINPNETVYFKKSKNVTQITSKELANYNLISPDSLLKIIPGLEYLQLKYSEKILVLENPDFYIIEPVMGSLTFNVYNVEPIIEHYD